MRQSKNVLTSVVVVFSMVVAGSGLALASQTLKSQSDRQKSTTKSSSRSRRTGSKVKSLENQMTVYSAASVSGGFNPEPISLSPESEKVELSATLDYIKERMSSYGSQKGYVESEVIKGSVSFDQCVQPKKTVTMLSDVLIASSQGEKPESAPPVPNCRMTWTVEYTDESNVKKNRTIALTLAHLNVDEVFQSQGVVWIKTAPYKAITVATGGTTLTEDEWWIDLHDEEVARRVGRALKHAAKVCRGEKYVEKFAK